MSRDSLELNRERRKRTEDFGVDNAQSLAKRMLVKIYYIDDPLLEIALMPWSHIVASEPKGGKKVYEEIKRLRSHLVEDALFQLKLRLSSRDCNIRNPVNEMERSEWTEMILAEARTILPQMRKVKKDIDRERGRGSNDTAI